MLDPLFLSGLDARAFAPRGAHAVFAAIPAPRRAARQELSTLPPRVE